LIDLRETKTEMITGPFYTISSNTFHQRRCFVFSRPDRTGI